MPRPSTLRRKAGSFLRQPLSIQAWFLLRWIILVVIKALIFTRSFRPSAPGLGQTSHIAPSLWPVRRGRLFCLSAVGRCGPRVKARMVQQTLQLRGGAVLST